MKARSLRILLMACLLACAAPRALALECIVPAKPGGGMDVACKMLRKIFPAGAGSEQVKLSYLPGGIGAVAWSSVVSKRRGGPDVLVTFSGGSLLNLAQGKYGKASVDDVRWVAGVGIDYGMIAVRSDAPWRSLRELMQAIRKDPARTTVGLSGTVGSQDWLKMALIASRAGIEPRQFRFVALEGGGDSFAALQAGHVQVISGDASEVAHFAAEGRVRILAVLSEQRLPGALQGVPTAREQGYDVVWPIIRGFYMSPHVPEADYRRWVEIFDKAMADPAFDLQRSASGLYPFAMTGKPLTDYIAQTVAQYRKQSQELGLVR
ncbi:MULTISPECIES: tripartite tricarboxylate transporter substrate binding protein [unclassified Herbaspirillum]|uniref:Bug family tripartite tricarboxylate transporter substrate binding protein n=1 Tax=unclassified Herbaspirillum TaxID=2624150 RepID=UPI0011519D80|nr:MULTISPECIES: tripartite tricarboxylate transporter substrate-binding protein [unclassified Herbaspirillum]MBB5390025.1 putative tricarboxylic transport membrane protein [Herbaspirillum sp. SJZ102]TQK09473.1 putative tricarboxylic transport membrane protein [Herbaspirillum sp. SJZ130]TQK13840.1 putative tricarboxylic transport membrane protein [Herbaspirillum sp. SJZ106]TWC69563.1 putative tricarboxylic transport membrane protein [Herbaspirillum sp. SJZ099]